MPLSMYMYPGVKLCPGESNAEANPVMDQHPTQGGSRNIHSYFMLRKPEINTGLMVH